jgi:hypothetical protein
MNAPRSGCPINLALDLERRATEAEAKLRRGEPARLGGGFCGSPSWPASPGSLRWVGRRLWGRRRANPGPRTLHCYHHCYRPLASHVTTKPRHSVRNGGASCFRSGPGASRTRDLLLRSAGPTASRRQLAPILPAEKGRTADWRSSSPAGIVIKSVIRRSQPAACSFVTGDAIAGILEKQSPRSLPTSGGLVYSRCRVRRGPESSRPPG